MNPFKYEVGVYGGCFCPPHTGHLSIILRAAAECRELYLVLSYSKKRDSIESETRFGWLRRMTAHLGNIKIIMLEDDCATKAEYDADSHWERGAAEVRAKIGKRIDAVYCSDEYDRPDNPYARCYPDSKMVFLDRSIIPCSSTAIRENPYANWGYLPNCVRPRYVKKILVVGNESTGKTTLVQSLAAYFNTNCVLEYGREICEKAGGEANMTEGDFIDILRGHKARIDAAVKMSNQVVFVDTDAVTTSYYASMNNNVSKDSRIFDKEWLKRFSDGWDLVFFMESDVPYVSDGVRVDERNSGNERQAHTDTLRSLYITSGFKLISVSGSYAERLTQCIELVKNELKGRTEK